MSYVPVTTHAEPRFVGAMHASPSGRRRRFWRQGRGKQGTPTRPHERGKLPRLVRVCCQRFTTEGGRANASEQSVGTLPQTVRRDFSGIDYAEAMRRAREVVPLLRERAQAAEDARMLIRANEQLLHEAGLFRFHQPKAFGGMELPFVAVVDIPAE